MRAVAQRVQWAKVEVDGAIVGAIESGLLVYVGIGREDDAADRAWVINKLTGLRIFATEEGRMGRSVGEVGGALLVVSQFTLYADLRSGRTPSFDLAMPAEPAALAYASFLRESAMVVPTQAGRFGADMMVASLNEGPVTMLLDSRAR